MKLHSPPRGRRAGLLSRAYTLIEVLAASAVVSVSMTAAVSLSSTLMLQEEMGWRVSVARNYQENMARLWQLGLTPATVSALMPQQTSSQLLNEIINGTPLLIEAGTADPGGLGAMQSAVVTTSVNISTDPRTERQGAPLTLIVYRASTPASLRPAAP